jgi:hypothetical protein
VVVDFHPVQGLKTAKEWATENCYFFVSNHLGGSMDARLAVFE